MHVHRRILFHADKSTCLETIVSDLHHVQYASDSLKYLTLTLTLTLTVMLMLMLTLSLILMLKTSIWMIEGKV